MNKFHTLKTNPILITYLFLFLFIACGEKPEVHISKTVQFEGKIYLLNSDDPFTGILFNEYSNGQREYEGYYKNGVPNGKLTYYFDYGSKMREGVLKNGSPAGRWIYYNSDGSIKEIIDH